MDTIQKTDWITRNYGGKVEVRKDGDSVKIGGRGIPFNTWSVDMWGMKERIASTAMDDVDLSDIYSFYNHDDNQVLGRTKSGTMEIDIRSDGVYYTTTPPEAAEWVKQNIERGDVDGSSFVFTVKKQEWEEMEDGSVQRTITQFDKVKEIGPVVSPAYPDSTAEIKRSFDAWKAEQKEDEPEDNQKTDALKRSILLRDKELEIEKGFINSK